MSQHDGYGTDERKAKAEQSTRGRENQGKVERSWRAAMLVAAEESCTAGPETSLYGLRREAL